MNKVIETSGSTQLFTESLGLVKPGGVISVVAFYEKEILARQGTTAHIFPVRWETFLRIYPGMESGRAF